MLKALMVLGRYPEKKTLISNKRSEITIKHDDRDNGPLSRLAAHHRRLADQMTGEGPS